MKLKKLARKVRRQAKKGRRKGTLSRVKYDAAIAVAGDELALRKLRDKIEDAHEADLKLAEGPLLDAIQNIWEWIKTNWPAILDFILTIAPLLLLDDDE